MRCMMHYAAFHLPTQCLSPHMYGRAGVQRLASYLGSWLRRVRSVCTLHTMSIK